MIDFNELSLQTIQSQYSASPKIMRTIKNFASRIDPNPDIDLFYRKIFNLDTAEGVGLDIWGEIVGIPRGVDVLDASDFFGFFGGGGNPYNQAPFYKKGATKHYDLTDQAYRRLIYYKAMANIGDATLATLNELLQYLYPGKRVFVLETGVMQIQITFMWHLEPWEVTIFNNYGLLAKGAGVGWEIHMVIPEEVLGFRGSDLQPFNQGTFTKYPPQ